MTATSIDVLTPREREILTMIAEGDSLAEIAQKLSRSLKTIESHRLALGKKLDASNRVELTHIAIAQGLIKVKTDHPGGTGRSDTAGLAEIELSWLQQINRACINATGATFIKRFCDAASLLPDITIAAICTPDPTLANGSNHRHRYVIAMSNRGVTGDPVRYHAVGTPCEAIIRDGESCFSQGVAQAYPADAWLQALHAESYIGIQLQRNDGSACGGLALIGKEPLENTQSYRNVIEFFAPRLAAELDICLELDALRNRCEHLELLSEALAGKTPINLADSTDTYPPTAVALTQIDMDVQSLAGAAFLRGFANSLSRRLGLYCAGICMFVDMANKETLASIMYSINGEIEENFTYSPADMPCEIAITKGFVSLPKGVTEEFPNKQYFTDSGTEAYIGTSIVDALGQTIGAMWVAHTKEISDPSTVEHVLRHYAPRVGAELSSFKQMEDLLVEQEQLKRELTERLTKAKLNA